MTAVPSIVADRYRLLQPLGVGGMGRVWRARDETLHRDVAVKQIVLPPELLDSARDVAMERTLREARAAARLSHPNVVRVYDVLAAEGHPWLVMEYVPSRSLDEVIRTGGPLEPQRVAEIGLAVLDALQAAHSAGVDHRDIKPGNVLLADDGRVVLTDFGIARVEGEGHVTRTGLVLGSPEFIAPERAREGIAGPASDLWSLGATLYAAVEGRSPFGRGSAMETLTALASQEADPPQRAGALAPVLRALLRKDPRARAGFAQAAELLRTAATAKPARRRRSWLSGWGRPVRPEAAAAPAVLPRQASPAAAAPVTKAERITKVEPAVEAQPAARGMAAVPPPALDEPPTPEPVVESQTAARGMAAVPPPALDEPPTPEPVVESQTAARSVASVTPPAWEEDEPPVAEAGSATAATPAPATEPATETEPATSGTASATPRAAEEETPATALGPTAPEIGEPDDAAEPETAAEPEPELQHVLQPEHEAEPEPTVAEVAASEEPEGADEPGPAVAAMPAAAVERAAVDEPASGAPAVVGAAWASQRPAADARPAVSLAPAAPRVVEEAEPGVGAVGRRASRGTRQRNAVLVGLGSLVVVALVVWLAIPSDQGEPGPGAAAPTSGAASSAAAEPSPSNADASASATTSPSAAAEQSSSAPAGDGLPTLPAGWIDYHDPTGFSVFVPANWNRSKDGSIVYFRDPAGKRLLGIDQTDKPEPDPVADWRGKSQYRVAHGDFPNYAEVHIQSVQYFQNAADWEFTFDRGGVRKHVNNRGVITSPTQAYGFYWETTDADWQAARPDLQLVFDSFRPRQ